MGSSDVVRSMCLHATYLYTWPRRWREIIWGDTNRKQSSACPSNRHCMNISQDSPAIHIRFTEVESDWWTRRPFRSAVPAHQPELSNSTRLRACGGEKVGLDLDLGHSVAGGSWKSGVNSRRRGGATRLSIPRAPSRGSCASLRSRSPNTCPARRVTLPWENTSYGTVCASCQVRSGMAQVLSHIDRGVKRLIRAGGSQLGGKSRPAN